MPRSTDLPARTRDERPDPMREPAGLSARGDAAGVAGEAARRGLEPAVFAITASTPPDKRTDPQ